MKYHPLPTYTETQGEAMRAIEEHLAERGYAFSCQSAWDSYGTGGIAYQTNKGANFALEAIAKPAKMGRYLTVNLYRMPSGRYEISAYIS